MREIGNRRELFVDGWLIERLEGATRVLHSPTPREVAIQFDAPWEGPVSFYPVMLEVDGQYRTYYRGLYGDGKGEEVAAVAISSDGIHWDRPHLGLIAWEGSTDNNIIWQGPGSHNFTPFVDANPAASADQRFKAVGRVKVNGRWGLAPFVSADGYRWRKLREELIITDGAFDSQNLVYWDTYRKHYVAFYRDFYKTQGETGLFEGIRGIKVATSPDFLHWTPGQWLDYGGAPLEHFYTNATVSYFRAPHLYLAFPKRFVPDRQVVPSHPAAGLSDAVFMSSRDGLHWDRSFLEAFVRPGRDLENWTERNIGVAWGILQTAPDELSLYWVEHYRHPTCRLRRGTLRLDGFVSVKAPYAGGEMVTHPLTFAGRELTVNYATSAVGSVQVELQQADGTPVEGHTLAESIPLIGDEIEAVVRWQGVSDVSALAGQPVRLRFVMKDADLYSLRFQK